MVTVVSEFSVRLGVNRQPSRMKNKWPCYSLPERLTIAEKVQNAEMRVVRDTDIPGSTKAPLFGLIYAVYFDAYTSGPFM